MTPRPLRSHILVHLEGTENGKLSEYQSDGGIFIQAGNLSTGTNVEDGLRARWAIVLNVGIECRDVKVNDRVLITQGKWTEALNVDGEWFWMSEEEHVEAIDAIYRETDGKEKVHAPVL